MKTVWRVCAPASHELITSAEAQRNAVRVDKLPRGAKITEHDAAGLRQDKLVVLDVAVDQIVRLQVLHGTLRKPHATHCQHQARAPLRQLSIIIALRVVSTQQWYLPACAAAWSQTTPRSAHVVRRGPRRGAPP